MVMTPERWAEVALRGGGLVVAAILAYRSDGLMSLIVVCLSLRKVLR